MRFDISDARELVPLSSKAINFRVITDRYCATLFCSTCTHHSKNDNGGGSMLAVSKNNSKIEGSHGQRRQCHASAIILDCLRIEAFSLSRQRWGTSEIKRELSIETRQNPFLATVKTDDSSSLELEANPNLEHNSIQLSKKFR